MHWPPMADGTVGHFLAQQEQYPTCGVIQYWFFDCAVNN